MRGLWLLCVALAGGSNSSVSFEDLKGHPINASLQNGSLVWCVDGHCYRPKSLRLDFNDTQGCRYLVTCRRPQSTLPRPSVTKLDLTSKVPAHIGPLVFRDGLAVQTIRPPQVQPVIPHQDLLGRFQGLEQRHELRRLRAWALEAQLGLTGDAREDLSLPATEDVGPDEGQSFPVPLAVGQVSIVLNWSNGSEPCVAVVESPGHCNSCSFGPGSCRANSRLQGPDKELLLSYQLTRPSFMLTEDLRDHEHSLCVRDLNGTVPRLRVLGRISYYRQPMVSFIKNILIVGVRTFINPGWYEEIWMKCTNCSSASQVVVQPITYDSRCRSVTQQMLAALAAANKHGEIPASLDTSGLRNSQMEEAAQHGNTAGINCPLPDEGPCAGYAQGAFAVAYHQASDYDDTHATFVMESSRRLTGHEKQIFFHHRSAICLYPGGPAAHGWLVGFAVVHMNVLDMQAFIGFVCFFGVALPLICLVTALLHYNKYERCKHHVRQLRLDYQRDQLERELATEEEPEVSRQRSGTFSASSSRETGSRGASELNYLSLAGEPRGSTSSAFLRPS